jgi:hypothetical protein
MFNCNKNLTRPQPPRKNQEHRIISGTTLVPFFLIDKSKINLLTRNKQSSIKYQAWLSLLMTRKNWNYLKQFASNYESSSIRKYLLKLTVRLKILLCRSSITTWKTGAGHSLVLCFFFKWSSELRVDDTQVLVHVRWLN